MDRAESQTVSLVGLAAALLIAALGFAGGMAYQRGIDLASLSSSFPGVPYRAPESGAGVSSPVAPAPAPPALVAAPRSVTARGVVAGIPLELQIPLPSAPAAAPPVAPPATVIETPALAPPDPCASPDDAVRQQAGCALDTQGAGYPQP